MQREEVKLSEDEIRITMYGLRHIQQESGVMLRQSDEEGRAYWQREYDAVTAVIDKMLTARARIASRDYLHE
jgi:hypothetical protein